MSKLNHIERLGSARIALMAREPFYGQLCMRMDFRPDPRIETAVADGKVIRFNPEYVDSLTSSQLVGLLAGLTSHIAMGHQLRRAERDKDKWNVATDYAISSGLVADGFELPSDKAVNPKYADPNKWFAESIYNDLPDQPQQCQGQGHGQGQGDQSGSDPNGAGGVDDQKNDDGSEMSESQRAEAEQELQSAVIAAAEQAVKKMGKLPAGWEEKINRLKQPPQIPWQAKIRHLLTPTHPTDYSWRRPNRRFIARGLYMPTTVKEGAGTWVVAFDTSGSMSTRELEVCANELEAIAEEVRPGRMVVYHCDAALHGNPPEIEVEPGCSIPVQAYSMRGRGGTDMQPIFDRITEMNIEPDVVVVFTDGYVPWHEEQPYRTIWAITNDDVEAPWGETVHVKP